MTNRMEWQPIETAPRDWGSIIIATDKGQVAEARMCEEGSVGWWSFDTIDLNDEDACHRPMAWMPMPTHPLADHPRPTTPVVDHEGGESDPQANRFTLVFEGDIRDFKGNPHLTDTPFGRPVASGIGSAFEQHDEAEARISELEAEVERLKRRVDAVAKEQLDWDASVAAIHSKYPIETEYERGYADGRREAAAAIRARSTAMNKGG